MPPSPPTAPDGILVSARLPDGVWRGDLATEMALSVDLLLLGKDAATSRNIHSNVVPGHSSEVFVPSANFFAPGLRSQLTGVSMYNGGWNQSYGPTMITPRHAILCGHNGPGVGDAMRFVSADGSQVFNTTQLKKINDYPGAASSDTKQTYVADVAIVLTQHEVPAWVYKAPVLNITSEMESELAGVNPPTLAVSQGNATAALFPSNPGAWTPNGRMLYVSAISPNASFNSLREPFARRPKVVGDSGTPDFIYAGGTMWLHRIINYSSGTGEIVSQRAAYINALIARADAAAGISTGYTVSVTDLEEIEFTNTFNDMPDSPVSILATVSGGSAPASPVVSLPAVSGGSAPSAPVVSLAKPGAVPAVIYVSGDLTLDDVPIVFPPMPFLQFNATATTKPEYYYEDEDVTCSLSFNVGEDVYELYHETTNQVWSGSADFLSIPGYFEWIPTGDAEGLPVVRGGPVVPVATVAVASEGSAPGSPVVILESAGGSGVASIILSGTASPNIDGEIPYAGELNGKPFWSNGLEGAEAAAVQYAFSAWYINAASISGMFSAYKVSDADSPVGLTDWTISSVAGSGDPVITAGSGSGPGAPDAPVSVLA